MTVSTRFSIFGYAIIFMSLHFVAFSLQDKERTAMSQNKFDEERVMSSQLEKEILSAVHVSSEVAVNHGVIGGRKMATMANHKEHMNSEETPTKKALSSLSKNPDSGNHKVHKRTKKVDHDDHQVEVKLSSTFMVINADYHIPRSHPPKNN